MPVSSSTEGFGSSIIRARGASIRALRETSARAGQAASKLASGKRFVGPHDGQHLLGVSKRNESQLLSLGAVVQANQLVSSALTMANNGLEQVQVQLIKIKESLIRAQTADQSQRMDFQHQIDLHLEQIDAIADTTRLGQRSLLDGESSVLSARKHRQRWDDHPVQHLHS